MTSQPQTIAEALEGSGALYYHELDMRTWFAYRPAPAYPGQWGQTVVILRDSGEIYTGDPWILVGNLPAGVARMPAIAHGHIEPRPHMRHGLPVWDCPECGSKHEGFAYPGILQHCQHCQAIIDVVIGE